MHAFAQEEPEESRQELARGQRQDSGTERGPLGVQTLSESPEETS